MNEFVFSDSKLRFKIIPWLAIDGSVNDEIFQNWLKIILTHCISYPRVKLNGFFSRFDYLKPVDICSLLHVKFLSFVKFKKLFFALICST